MELLWLGSVLRQGLTVEPDWALTQSSCLYSKTGIKGMRYYTWLGFFFFFNLFLLSRKCMVFIYAKIKPNKSHPSHCLETSIVNILIAFHLFSESNVYKLRSLWQGKRVSSAAVTPEARRNWPDFLPLFLLGYFLPLISTS